DYIREKLPTKPAIKKDGKISTAQIDSDVPTVVQAIVENGEDTKDYTEFLEKIATTSKPFFERWPVPRSKELLRQEKRDIIAIARRHLKPRKHYPRHFDRTKCRWDCE